jgi:hypothetical protein
MVGRRLEEAHRRAQGTVRDSSPAVAYCDPEAAQALVAFSDALEGIEAGVPVDPTALQETFGILRAALTDAALAAGRDEALADGASRRLSDEAATMEREADVVRERAEVLPEIPQYEELLAVLQEKAPGAIPLYRLLDLSRSFLSRPGARSNVSLGRAFWGRGGARVKSCHGKVCVLAHGHGVEVLDPEVLQGSPDRTPPYLAGIPCQLAMKKRGDWPCPT